MISLPAFIASASTAAEVTETLTWHKMMVIWTVEVGIWIIVAGMLICIYRLLKGPHLADRAVAVDTLSVQLIGLVILISMRLGTLVFFDGILVMSLLGFAGTVAIAQYIGRPHAASSVSPSYPAESTTNK